MFVTSDPVWSETVQISGQDIQTYITINTSSKYCEKERKHFFRFSFNSFSFFAFASFNSNNCRLSDVCQISGPSLYNYYHLGFEADDPHLLGVEPLVILHAGVPPPLLVLFNRNIKIVLIKLKLFINPK